MRLFKDLTDEEQAQFRQWARDNYKPFTEIQGFWHPIVQEECVLINRETNLRFLATGNPR